MKYLICLLILISYNAEAAGPTQIEYITGGLTNHLWSDGQTSSMLSNKLFNDGKWLYTPIQGIGLIFEQKPYYRAIRAFGGLNSVGSQMYGMTISSGLSSDWFDFGAIAGLYIQNDNDFYNRGIKPFSVMNGVVPVIGTEFNLKLDITKDYYIKLNNIISPAITNHTISLGMHL